MRGGKRSGAGRPNGAKTKRTSEVAKKAAAEGTTPLEYMLSVLRKEDATDSDKRWAAEKAAPYIHPRLSSVDVKADLTIGEMTGEQLDRAIEDAAAKAGIALTAAGKGTSC